MNGAKIIQREELANVLTHGLGIIAGIAATAILVVVAALQSDAWGIVGAAIFGATLVVLYSASTVYHAVRGERLKARLKVLAMGWLVVLAVGPMIRELALPVLLWLVAGGLAYTAGTVFYHGRMRYTHAVWHLFVLAGSGCHAVAVGLQL